MDSRINLTSKVMLLKKIALFGLMGYDRVLLLALKN